MKLNYRIILLTLAVVGSAWATNVDIYNYTFGVGGDTGWTKMIAPGGSAVNAGWNDVIAAGWFNSADCPFDTQVEPKAIITAFGNSAFAQELTETYQANTTYVLEIDVGAPNREPDSFRYLNDWIVTLRYGMDLVTKTWNSGTVVATAASGQYGIPEPNGHWIHVKHKFTIGGTGSAIGQMIQLQIGPGSAYPIWDTVKLNRTFNIAVSEQSGGSTYVYEQGATTDTISFFLRQKPSQDVTLNFASSDTSQMTVSPASLTFTPSNWFTYQTVTVKAVDDVIPEGPHTALLLVTSTSGDPDLDGEQPDITVNIVDNDTTPGVTIQETGGSTNVTEGGATDTYSAVLNSPPTSTVTITINHNGQVSTNVAQLIFDASNWYVPQTVTVTAVDDALSEGPHTSTISHVSSSSDTTYNGIAIANVVAHITDNEAYCGQQGTTYLSADVNHDCYINFKDFAVIAQQWLRCTDPFQPVLCQ
jgi:hypothetical protein